MISRKIPHTYRQHGFVYGNEKAIDGSEINNEFDWSTVYQVKVIVPTSEKSKGA